MKYCIIISDETVCFSRKFVKFTTLMPGECIQDRPLNHLIDRISSLLRGRISVALSSLETKKRQGLLHAIIFGKFYQKIGYFVNHLPNFSLDRTNHMMLLDLTSAKNTCSTCNASLT